MLLEVFQLLFLKSGVFTLLECRAITVTELCIFKHFHIFLNEDFHIHL